MLSGKIHVIDWDWLIWIPIKLMLCLFQNKMIFIVKKYLRNHFHKKWFSLKYFTAFDSYEKITKCENQSLATATGNGDVAVAEFRRAGLAGLLQIRSDPTGLMAGSVQIRPASNHSRNSTRFRLDFSLPKSGDGGRMSPNSNVGRISVTERAGFRRLTIAWLRQSDIKHACKDEEFNFRKRFTILKIINRFLKIKEIFTFKLKMIFVDHYFCPYQTP